jgi:hypothetical protein
MLQGHFKSCLLILEEVPYILDLREIEKRLQLSLCIEEDVQGLNFFPALQGEVRGIALENMRQIRSQPIDLIGPEGVHVVLCDQGAFSRLDPGQLYFLVTVKMGIEMWQHIFLHNDSLVVRHR